MEYFVAYLIFAYSLNFIVIAYWVGTKHPICYYFPGPGGEYGVLFVPCFITSPATCNIIIFILFTMLFRKIFGTYG